MCRAECPGDITRRKFADEESSATRARRADGQHSVRATRGCRSRSGTHVRPACVTSPGFSGFPPCHTWRQMSDFVRGLGAQDDEFGPRRAADVCRA